MNRSRFTEEQIIAILRGQEAGSKKADVCRKHGVSSPAFDKVYRLSEVGECQITDLGAAHILVELITRVISVAIGGHETPRNFVLMRLFLIDPPIVHRAS